jgi:uncharacterized protein (TIGR03066 family)
MSRVAASAVLAVLAVVAWTPGHVRADVLINKAGGLVLDAHDEDVKKNGCTVQLWKDVRAPQQQWQVESVGDGVYKIVNKASGLVLDAHSDDVDKNGCRVQLWEYKKEKQQHWKLVKAGEFYKIVNLASGRVLDAHSDDVKKNGCRVQLWEDGNGEQQLWQLKKTDAAGSNKDRIVGKWTSADKTSTAEFTKDGKLKITSNNATLNGTYQFTDENTLEMTIEIMGAKRARKVTIKSLSATELIAVNPDGKEDKMTKVK